MFERTKAWAIPILIGGLVAWAGLRAVIAYLADPHAPLLPFAEANQGLLSLLALGAALGVAAFEFVRAERAYLERRREFIDLVLDLLSGIAKQGPITRGQLTTGAKPSEIAMGFLDVQIPAAATINLIRQSVPPHARLAIQMQKLWEVIGPHWNWQASDPIVTLDALLESIREARLALEGIRAERR